MVENVKNPLFPHRGRMCYSKAAAVIQGQLDARAADVEREMVANGPAAYEVIACCHWQALDFTELRATYSRQLAGRLVNARESIKQVGTREGVEPVHPLFALCPDQEHSRGLQQQQRGSEMDG